MGDVYDERHAQEVEAEQREEARRLEWQRKRRKRARRAGRAVRRLVALQARYAGVLVVTEQEAIYMVCLDEDGDPRGLKVTPWAGGEASIEIVNP